LFDALDHWGEGRTLPIFAPSVPDTPAARHARGAFERAAMSPGLARALLDAIINLDIGEILPTIRVPTLVLHRAAEIIPVEHARWVASQIPGSTLVEVPGVDHQPWIGDAERILTELEQFVTGHTAERPAERQLATVLFSDIVGSTEIARAEGDHRWKEQLDDFESLARRQIVRSNGQFVKTTGDGLLARFTTPDDALQAAFALHRIAEEFGFALRSGLHTGGVETRGDGDVAGIAVHMAARVQAAAQPNEILVTRTVTELLEGSAFAFADRGEHELKGIEGTRRLFSARASATV
jgi:class 3 adenylate cyclase